MSAFRQISAFQEFSEYVHGKVDRKPPHVLIQAFHEHVETIAGIFITTGDPAAGRHPGDIGQKVDDYMFHQVGDVGNYVRATVAGRKLVGQPGSVRIEFQIIKQVFPALMLFQSGQEYQELSYDRRKIGKVGSFRNLNVQSYLNLLAIGSEPGIQV